MQTITSPSVPLVATSARPAPLANMRLLLTDDGPDNRMLVGFLLKRAGAIVTEAHDGAQAISKAIAAATAHQPFDAVLMDVQMPEMDGCAATAKLRELGFTLPIIALTAHTGSAEKQRCLNSGYTEFVTKPPEIAALVEVLLRVSGRCAAVLPH